MLGAGKTDTQFRRAESHSEKRFFKECEENHVFRVFLMRTVSVVNELWDVYRTDGVWYGRAYRCNPGEKRRKENFRCTNPL